MRKKANSRRNRSIEEWRGIVRRQVESGLTVKQYCERESVCEQSFYSWRKRLGSEVPVLPAKFVELTAPPPVEAVVRVELQLPNGAVLRIA